MLPSSFFYDIVADYYNSYCAISHINNFLEEEISLIEKEKPKSIIEFGIGTGRFARAYLAKHKVHSYIGVDNSEKMLLLAQDSGATLVLADFGKYLKRCIFINKKVDCIVAPYTAIHHIETNKQVELFNDMRQVANVIIINCVTKEKECEMFRFENETTITFPLQDNNVVETVVYKLHETLREHMVTVSTDGGRENLQWKHSCL